MTWRRLAHIEPDPDAGLMPYLHRALTNRVRTEHRRVRRTAAPSDAAIMTLGFLTPSPLEATLAQERRRGVRRALMTLNSRSRGLIQARFDLGLPWLAVAALFGFTSADAARLATSRALRHLSAALARQASVEDGSPRCRDGGAA